MCSSGVGTALTAGVIQNAHAKLPALLQFAGFLPRALHLLFGLGGASGQFVHSPKEQSNISKKVMAIGHESFSSPDPVEIKQNLCRRRPVWDFIDRCTFTGAVFG
jgi:hypothetical protein